MSIKRVLVVKLSSLGDVVHTAPAVADIVQARAPEVIDWVVEEGFADLPQLMRGVRRVIPVALRRWRRQGPLSQRTRAEFAQFREALRAERYTHVIDFQGLIKSAWVGRLATLAPEGRRYGLGNRTDGAGYEPLARLLYDCSVRMAPHTHAIERSRQLAADVLDYAVPPQLRFGMQAPPLEAALAASLSPRYAVFVHGSSRADKCWLQHHWVSLGQAITAQGLQVLLPWGSPEELLAAKEIAARIGHDTLVLPKLALAQVAAVLAGAAVVVGVDSGLVHLATALGRPTVQLYNLPTQWRTGAYGDMHALNVGGERPPSLHEVQDALQRVMAAQHRP